MSLFDGKPIGRIQIGQRDPVPGNPNIEEPVNLTIADLLERERIWRAVRATAEGTNISTPEEA